jgi:hypothetical protein
MYLLSTNEVHVSRRRKNDFYLLVIMVLPVFGRPTRFEFCPQRYSASSASAGATAAEKAAPVEHPRHTNECLFVLSCSCDNLIISLLD